MERVRPSFEFYYPPKLFLSVGERTFCVLICRDSIDHSFRLFSVSVSTRNGRDTIILYDLFSFSNIEFSALVLASHGDCRIKTDRYIGRFKTVDTNC